MNQPSVDHLSPTEPPDEGLTIRISRGVGSGRTRLSAFDGALRDAGVADCNLVRLSSVIPPGSVVKEVSGRDQIQSRHGDILYCVYAEAFASTPGSEAWAGVAWSEREDGTGSGLFVEQSGLSQNQVSRDLEMTLEDLSLRRDGRYQPAGTALASAICEDHPVCALVIASYQVQGWGRS